MRDPIEIVGLRVNVCQHSTRWTRGGDFVAIKERDCLILPLFIPLIELWIP